MSEQKITDLRDWGWAPGHYVVRCIDCMPDGKPLMARWPEGDKRAWRCETCARKAMEAARAR